MDRHRHVGARVCAGLLGATNRSTVLRTLWRAKDRATLPGVGSNSRPDYQELLTNVRLVVWLDSSEEESQGETLESRVALALDHPGRIERFGGLSLGESTHLVDWVGRLREGATKQAEAYLLAGDGRLSLPVWVDHVGSAGTRYVTGEIVTVSPVCAPSPSRIAKIEPP
jgi:CRISPR-associated protein Cas5t